MATLDSNITTQQAREDRAIYRAMGLIEKRLRKPGAPLSNPNYVRQFLTIFLSGFDREVFSVLWLDSQHCLIEAEHLFFGTLTQTSVYPREVARRALQMNAAAVMFAHNHPSGRTEPSHSDIALTAVLTSSLALVDVQVLDHFIVAGIDTLSFAEKGLMGAASPSIEAVQPSRKRGRPRRATA
jgi:DNA repair protein RadC